jgi:hypothetical protein
MLGAKPAPPKDGVACIVAATAQMGIGRDGTLPWRPVWKSTSHFSVMTRPCWLRRAVRNRHRHAVGQASRRWRGGRHDDTNAP